MWDALKDCMNSFLGAVALFLSLFFIPEIRRKKLFIFGVSILCAGLIWLGIDKISRDIQKDRNHEQQRQLDSLQIVSLKSDIKSLSESYKKDTTRFADFKKQLESDFHIKDSGNIPVQIHNYKPIFNTHINKADRVKIG